MGRIAWLPQVQSILRTAIVFVGVFSILLSCKTLFAQETAVDIKDDIYEAHGILIHDNTGPEPPYIYGYSDGLPINALKIIRKTLNSMNLDMLTSDYHAIRVMSLYTDPQQNIDDGEVREARNKAFKASSYPKDYLVPEGKRGNNIHGFTRSNHQTDMFVADDKEATTLYFTTTIIHELHHNFDRNLILCSLSEAGCSLPVSLKDWATRLVQLNADLPKRAGLNPKNYIYQNYTGTSGNGNFVKDGREFLSYISNAFFQNAWDVLAYSMFAHERGNSHLISQFLYFLDVHSMGSNQSYFYKIDTQSNLTKVPVVIGRDVQGRLNSFVVNGQTYFFELDEDGLVKKVSNPINSPPTVSVDSAPSSIKINGAGTIKFTAEDDGYPSNPGSLSISAIQLQGPTSPFALVNDTSLVALFSRIGQYKYRLRVSDGAKVTYSEDIEFDVWANQIPPEINYYPHPTLTRVGDVNLLRVSTSDDGLPVSPGRTTTTWKVRSKYLSGVDNYTVTHLEDQNMVEIKFHGTGIYHVYAKVFDGEYSNEAITTITVVHENSNIHPLGDANRDTKIDVIDALHAAKMAVGSLAQDVEVADVNEDDRVDATDVLAILKYSVGALDSLPVVTNPNFNVNVLKFGQGDGKVESRDLPNLSPAFCAYDCGKTQIPSRRYDASVPEKVKISRPEANPGSFFVGWQGNCANGKASCKVKVDDEKLVYVHFETPSRTTPDLVIQEIKVKAKLGKAVKVKSTVKNVGDHKSHDNWIRMRLDVDSSNGYDFTEYYDLGRDLRKDDRTTARFSLDWEATAGTHIIEVCADTHNENDKNNLINEEKEGNNCNYSEIVVDGRRSKASVIKFTKDLSVGSKGPEVVALQQYLIDEQSYEGDVTGVFDHQTMEAVNDYQMDYEDEILGYRGLSGPTGVWDYSSRRLANFLRGFDIETLCFSEPTPDGYQCGAPFKHIYEYCPDQLHKNRIKDCEPIESKPMEEEITVCNSDPDPEGYTCGSSYKGEKYCSNQKYKYRNKDCQLISTLIAGDATYE